MFVEIQERVQFVVFGERSYGRFGEFRRGVLEILGEPQGGVI